MTKIYTVLMPKQFYVQYVYIYIFFRRNKKTEQKSAHKHNRTQDVWLSFLFEFFWRFMCYRGINELISAYSATVCVKFLVLKLHFKYTKYTVPLTYTLDA